MIKSKITIRTPPTRLHFSDRLKISPFASRVFKIRPGGTFVASRKTFSVAASIVME